MSYMYDVKKAETIKKVYESKSGEDVSVEDIEMAFENYHYYINPKKSEVLFAGHRIMLCDYIRCEVENGVPHGTTNKEVAIPICHRIVKELFDREYFEERLEYHKNHDDKECLCEFMHKLDVTQLKGFIPVLMSTCFVFSWHDKEVECVWNRLNEACLKENADATVSNDLYDKYGYINREIPIYFFDYLDKKAVVNIICNSIREENRYRAAILARMMYAEGIDAVEYRIIEWECDCCCEEQT